MPRRNWRHRTRVYPHGVYWLWECYKCGKPLYPVSYETQEAAFTRAHHHTSVGGYIPD